MLSYIEFRNLLENGKASVIQQVKETLLHIKEYKELNCYITVCEDLAIHSAYESEKRFHEGNPRKLEGLIIAIKDNISTKNIRTTCASKILENYNPIFDATSVERLINEGAIIIGKTNMDEFAMGSSNESSYFGNVLNPLNKEYVPGGSSGGSAVAVAANLCHVSLGSETGGSVRQPAAFTGLFGLKPSYGAISRWGLIAFGSSLDQIGIFGRDINDVSLVYDVISGNDPKDSTSTSIKNFNTFSQIDKEVEKLTVGVIGEKELKYADFDVLKNYQNSLIKLERAGHKLEEIEFPYSSIWIPTYYIIAAAEASSNLARYDGVRFGYRAEQNEGEDFMQATRSSGFGIEVKRRILLGTYVLSEGHHDQFYIKALKARRKIKENYDNILSNHDIVFLPSTPTCAFKFNEKANNPVAMYMSDIYVAAANLAGIPAINIPIGVNNVGLPIGLQIQSSRYDEAKLLNISKYLYDLFKN